MRVVKVFYVLVVTLVAIVFLYRQSIDIYWSQTYHSNSPLTTWMNSQPVIEIAETESDVSNDVIEVADTEIKEPIEVIDNSESTEEIAEISTTIDTAESVDIELVENEVVEEIVPEVMSSNEIVVKEGDALFFVGDSLMQGVAPRVKESVYKDHKIEGIDLSKQSTGLSYPSFFNWPEVVEKTLDKHKNIKAVLVFLGPNDPWDFPVKGQKKYLRFKSEAWEEAYRERIQRILLAAQKHNAKVLWMGAPCMRKTKLHKDVVYLNELYESEVTKFNGRYIPTNETLGCTDIKYSAYVKTERGNVKVRTDDGIHFSVKGQRMLADQIIAELTIPSLIEEENKDG